MKNVINFLIFSFVLSSLLPAQTPQYYNYNTTNNGNTFPFGTSQGRMIQCLILPGDFNHPGTAGSGNITKLYCMVAANFGPFTYSQLSILLGQTTLTTMAAGVFYTGDRDTVYKRAAISLSGTQSNWLSFTFDHPFLYDSTKSLIIQIEQFGAPGAAGYILGNTYLTGRRRTYSTIPPFAVQGQDAYVYNVGVDIGPVTGAGSPSITQVPNKYFLEQNYPNPFNPSTNIKFGVPQKSFVKLRVFDILGREVSVLVNKMMNAGSYSVDWNASTYHSGVFFYRLETQGCVETKRMILLK
ncbi:MAG: T9SS type A sorting domain-containing protein [Ignavibacteria bacterium]|nr:T9SS type A sorting domain-containing protein [Ignavibacteria bacterium]